MMNVKGEYFSILKACSASQIFDSKIEFSNIHEISTIKNPLGIPQAALSHQ